VVPSAVTVARTSGVRTADWMRLGLLEYCHTRIAVPSGAMAGCTWYAPALVSECVVVAPHVPPEGFTLDWMRYRTPSHRYQAMIASPFAEVATSGAKPFWPASETSATDPQTPPEVRSMRCTRYALPSYRSQTATMAPSAWAARRGMLASCPAADRDVPGPHEPPDGRSAVWMMVFAPSDRAHMATIAPAGVTVTSGWFASCPAADRIVTALHAPEPDRCAVSMRVLLPSDRFHARTVSPVAFIATAASAAPDDPTVAGEPHTPAEYLADWTPFCSQAATAFPDASIATTGFVAVDPAFET